MRLERQGAAGSRDRSSKPNPAARARTVALSIPASTKGWRTPCSSAAFSPGRQSPRSSTFVPESRVASVRAASAP